MARENTDFEEEYIFYTYYMVCEEVSETKRKMRRDYQEMKEIDKGVKRALNENGRGRGLDFGKTVKKNSRGGKRE